MIVCHSEHSFCTDFSVLELYLADSGKYSRSSGYFMHTENLHTMHTACCRNSKSSMIVWHFEHSQRFTLDSFMLTILILNRTVSKHTEKLLKQLRSL